MQRETIQQAAKRLLGEPVGTERTVTINTNDGLTGLPPGMSPRGARMKDNVVRVDQQTRAADGKKRVVVVLVGKGTVLAAGAWA
jgi:hypothetical protein